ncbi:MAG: preprotein translocase subunit SecA [Crocinitomix sp.]|jgi:preprotein translocase subunit SecA
MFSFFKKKKKSIKSTDKIWRSSEEKVRGLEFDIEAFLAASQNVFLFYYFEDTKKTLVELLNQKGINFDELERANRGTKLILVSAAEIKSSARIVDTLRKLSDPNSSQFLFANHYPKYYFEAEILEELIHLHDSVIECCFYVAMDEPLMRVFGSEGIVAIMDRLGYKEGEVIQHAMITKSISRAQKKIDKNNTNELRANSQEEWFQANLPSGV